MSEIITRLAEQIMRLLNGGDYSVSDSKWDIREIELAVEQFASKLIRLRVFEDYAMGEEMAVGQYLATFTGEPVKKDSVRNLSYIDIPVQYINLPKGRGIQSIGPEANESLKYIPCESGIMSYTNLRQAPFLQGNIGYWTEGQKAFFTSDITGNVIIKLVTGQNVIADMESDIVNQVYFIYRTEKPEDKVINANEE